MAWPRRLPRGENTSNVYKCHRCVSPYRGYDLVWDHLTLATVECYWLELLTDYASVTQWTVQPDPSLVVIR